MLDHLEVAVGSVRGAPAVGRARREGLRWTPPADRHVTVAFYGEVPEGYLDDMVRALSAAAAGVPPFSAALAGAGLFDGRTLWVGLAGDGWPPLMAAAGRVGADLLGREQERRSRPHLTIARARPGARGRDARGRDARGRGDGARGGAGRGVPAAGRGASGEADPAALAHALALYRGPTWQVRDVVLVSSHLGAGPGGTPRHDVVHVAGLGAVAG